jgi:hypothetical protein
LQYGLIAEEVADVYPNLVEYNKNGEPVSVLYHLLTPMLLNELQKLHRESEAQIQRIGEQTAVIERLVRQQREAAVISRIRKATLGFVNPHFEIGALSQCGAAIYQSR